jgi:alpha-L-rhamnosidase
MNFFIIEKKTKEKKMKVNSLFTYVSFLVIISFICSETVLAAIEKPEKLRCEYIHSPLGVDVARPRFSWVLHSLDQNEIQTAYRIEVYQRIDQNAEENEKVWTSDWVSSSEQNGIEYNGQPLKSKTQYWWKVQVKDGRGNPSPWSDPEFFETGILNQNKWQGEWIGGDFWYLRKEFSLPDKEIVSARAYVSGLGQFHFRLNGKDVVPNEARSPGISQYEKTILYRVYDVKDYLNPRGGNAVGFVLGPHQFFDMESRKCILELDIWFQDGSHQKIISDQSWKGNKNGPITMNLSQGVSYSFKAGEFYDAREELTGWDKTGFNDVTWEEVELKPETGDLRVQLLPVTENLRLYPVEITSPEQGIHVIDFGLNISGWVEFWLEGNTGETMTITYGENLYPDGHLDPRSSAPGGKKKLPGAPQQDQYIFKGGIKENWEPFFSIKGFRYVEIRGFTARIDRDNIIAKQVNTDVRNQSYFNCSNPLFNKIQKAYRQAMLNCLQSIPVDNVHEEHQGWVGEDHFLSEVRHLNFDMAYFYHKWLRDIRESQNSSGSIPNVCPRPSSFSWFEGIWAAGVVLSTWDAYQATGDLKYLNDQYLSMKNWLTFYKSQTQNYIAKPRMGRWFGHAGYELDNSKYNPYIDEFRSFGATTVFYESIITFIKIAEILERNEDVQEFSSLADNILAAFNEKWLKEGYYFLNSQTTNALPLYAELVPEEFKDLVFRNLMENFYEYDLHWTGGLIFLKHLFKTLCDYGASDVAYKLADANYIPSYGHALENLGATAIIEHFDGDLTQSFSQNTSGDISLYFFEYLAGIKKAEPGYRKVKIKPAIPTPLERKELNRVDAQIETVRGLVKSSWNINQQGYYLNAEIPVNAQAKICVPAISPDKIVLGGQPWKQSTAIKFEGMEGKYAVFAAGSGSYSFYSPDVPEGEIYPYPKGATITKDINDFIEVTGIGKLTVLNENIYLDVPENNEEQTDLSFKVLFPVAMNGDFEFEADFELLESGDKDGFAMIFGHQNDSTFNYIALNKKEPMVPEEKDSLHGLFVKSNDQLLQYRDFYSAHEIKAGRSYRLKLRCKNEQAVVFLDDNLVCIIPKINGKGKVGFGSLMSDIKISNPIIIQK